MPGNVHDESERDEDLAKRVQKGEEESFRLLVARYKDKLTRYARRFLFDQDDAKDLVQEVFIKAYVNIKTFDTARRFSPWLYRIAHNEFVNALRKRTAREKVEAELYGDDRSDAPAPQFLAKETADGSMRRGEIREMFYHALGKLDPKYREPLVLYYFEEMNYKTIAEVLQLPLSTVGVRLQRGKAMLKNLVKDKL
jgi:RNA polymerase sigma-70 factor (ECF subfamily)